VGSRLDKKIADEAAPFEGEIVFPKKARPNRGDVARMMDRVEGVVEDAKTTKLRTLASAIFEAEKIVQFRGDALILVHKPFNHFVKLSRNRFEAIVYPIAGPITRTMVSDVYAYVRSEAEDYGPFGHLIGFGQNTIIEDDTDLHPPTVWDAEELSLISHYKIDNCVWRSPYPKIVVDKDEAGNHLPIPFILSLAGGDVGVYDDIMQSIAPIVMDKKPDGVIWWVGTGANGKSTLMDALYKLFPNQFASINVKRLTDGRDLPSLNGKLANIVKESSEGRIDDTDVYKSLGTHESFRVHKFHQQEDEEINGNIHSIFSANTIPTFNDKGFSARRRTFVIPFTQTFVSDPDFEVKTFTPEFFGKLAFEICKYANRLKRQGYKYKWSGQTLNAKLEYDHEANNAEEYAKQLIDDGVVAFHSYNPVRMDYENWCADNGYVPLGITNMRKALSALGFERSTSRDDGKIDSIYKLPDTSISNLEPYGMGRIGLFTAPGFRKHEAEPEPEEKQTSILNNEW
jgi:hypothetical protein